jgi:hypothetical protein
MNRVRVFILASVVATVWEGRAIAQSRTIKDCDASLVPTVEQTNSDYSRMQDFLYYNAAQEYDRLSKLAKEQRTAEASYKVAQAEYNESKSASEFQERMTSRIDSERSRTQESTSSSNYRRGLEQSQLSAWSECVRAVTGGGAVFLVAEKVDPSAFPLTVRWYPATGQTEGTLTLKIANATVDGSAEIRAKLVGSGSKPFIVVPDQSSNPIVITAEILRSADVVSLPRKFPAPTRPPVICLRQDQVRRYSASDDFLKAETNYAPCLTHRASTGATPDIDAWYRISVLNRGTLSVNLRGISQEFELQVRDANGAVVARPNPKKAKGSQALKYTVGQPGEYLVRPQPISGPSDYELQVSFEPSR